MSTYIGDVIVSNNFLENVKEALGYPVLDQEISDIYSDEHIKDLVISDALEFFYNHFPIIETLTVPMGVGKTSIDAPDKTLGVVHYAFVNSAQNNQMNLNSGNPFYTARLTISANQSSMNFGSPFNYGSSEYSTYQQQFYQNSMQKSNRMYAVYFDERNMKLNLQSSQSGTMVIKLGLYSENVADIPNRIKPHLLNYCQGLLKVKFAEILEMMNSDLPLEFDKELIRETGEKMMEEETEWCLHNSTIQVMR